MRTFKDLIYSWLTALSGDNGFAKLFTTLIVGATIIVLAFILLFIVRRILIGIIHRVAQKTTSEWDDILVESKFFNGVAQLLPAAIFYFWSGYANEYYPHLQGYIMKFSNLYFLFAFILIANSLLNTLNEIYNKSFTQAKERPISGVIQLVKIILYFICSLVFISIIFNKSIVTLFTGLGAAAAILMLVFKDSILGFVASIQIGMNKLVKVGDYIEFPDKKLDGTVTEINLTCVKIQNSDKTVISLPTYSLVSESFINWDGMEKSGVRRIRRAIKIDITSVKFCDEMMMGNFRKNQQINQFINIDELEIQQPTNLGIFRAFIGSYLRNYPTVAPEANLVVRHLQPTETGIPIEITVYSKEQRWPEYEKIQSDIFDYILAVVPAFELRIFQNPTGFDFKSSKN
jgi:miniconductance mechanosensitive channel